MKIFLIFIALAVSLSAQARDTKVLDTDVGAIKVISSEVKRVALEVYERNGHWYFDIDGNRYRADGETTYQLFRDALDRDGVSSWNKELLLYYRDDSLRRKKTHHFFYVEDNNVMQRRDDTDRLPRQRRRSSTPSEDPVRDLIRGILGEVVK